MKKFIVALACIILTVFVVLVIGIFNIGFIVKTAVNAYGPELTKTEMRLEGADVSVLEGRARLENFIIGNPDGFKASHAIRVASVFVDVDETSVTEDIIIIDFIEVNHLEITYEIKGNTDNIHTIINKMKKEKNAGKTTETKKAEHTGKKRVVIRDLVLKDVNVIMAVPALNGEAISTSISEIHFKNIGQKENGVLLSELFLRVLTELYGQIISPDVISVLTKEMKVFGVEIENLGRQTRRQLESIADDLYEMKDEVETITDQFKELLGK